MRLWPRKWFEVKIFTSNNFQVRRAEREREREREREKSLWCRRAQSPDLAPPQTRRWDRAVEFAPPRSSHRDHRRHCSRSRPKVDRRCRYRSRSRCSSAPLLPISFSFLTQSSSALPISSSRSHRTNDLVVSISSSSLFPWSFRSLFLPPSLSLTKFVWRVWKF